MDPIDGTIQAMRDDMNRLRGKLFQMVESWGVPPKQEDAMKGLIRHLTYDSQAALESSLRERAK